MVFKFKKHFTTGGTRILPVFSLLFITILAILKVNTAEGGANGHGHQAVEF